MKRIGILMLGFLLCFVSVAWPQARPEWGNKIITFDVPGAGTSAGQGTFPTGITSSGSITGWWLDANNTYHGFLRLASGGITTFDAPGAGTAAGQGTIAYGMNAAGAVTGGYFEANGAFHGFLRTADGAFVKFDAPNAGTGSNQAQQATTLTRQTSSRACTWTRIMSITA